MQPYCLDFRLASKQSKRPIPLLDQFAQKSALADAMQSMSYNFFACLTPAGPSHFSATHKDHTPRVEWPWLVVTGSVVWLHHVVPSQALTRNDLVVKVHCLQNHPRTYTLYAARRACACRCSRPDGKREQELPWYTGAASVHMNHPIKFIVFVSQARAFRLR